MIAKAPFVRMSMMGMLAFAAFAAGSAALAHEVERAQAMIQPTLDKQLELAFASTQRIATAHTISIALSGPARTTPPAMGK